MCTKKYDKLKHVSRYSYEDGHSFNGFRVCVTREGHVYQRYFSAAVLGWAGALEAALLHRKRLYKALGIGKRKKPVDM